MVFSHAELTVLAPATAGIEAAVNAAELVSVASLAEFLHESPTIRTFDAPENKVERNAWQQANPDVDLRSVQGGTLPKHSDPEVLQLPLESR
jgi:hypothetical protein